MSYTKTNWVNDTEPAINATNLNKIEQGIYDNDVAISEKIDNTYGTSQTKGYSQEYVNNRFDGTKPMGDIVVDSIRSKNLFDKNRLWNAWINAQGDLVESASNRVSDYIDIHGMSHITISGSTAIAVIDAFYDSSKTFVSHVEVSTETATLQVPNNAYYIRVTLKPTALDTYQIEGGSTATPYTPHQELNNQEVYSTGETKIGTWINGKPLYRSVANTSVSLTANTWTNLRYKSGEEALINCIISDCNNFTDANSCLTYPVISRLYGNYIQIYSFINTTVKCVIVEYTKTTD